VEVVGVKVVGVEVVGVEVVEAWSLETGTLWGVAPHPAVSVAAPRKSNSAARGNLTCSMTVLLSHFDEIAAVNSCRLFDGLVAVRWAGRCSRSRSLFHEQVAVL
jgi:hypothetical protein